MGQLSAIEIASYRDEGWVKPQFRLPAERVRLMRDALDELISRNPGVRPEKLVSAHIEGDNGEGVRGSAAFLELARDPEIVELAAHRRRAALHAGDLRLPPRPAASRRQDRGRGGLRAAPALAVARRGPQRRERLHGGSPLKA